LSLLEAFKCLLARDLDTAKSHVERYKVLKERSIIGRTILAAYFSQHTEYDKSLLLLDELITENPKATFYRKLRADILFYQQKYTSASEDYKIYIADNEDDTKALYRLSRTLFINQNYTDGLVYAQKLFDQPVKDDLHFASIIENNLLAKSSSVNNTFIDKTHINELKSVIILLNKNNADAAKEKVDELILNESSVELLNKYNSLYLYIKALISILENNFNESLLYLYEAYADYPTREIKSLIDEFSNSAEEHVSDDKLFIAGKEAFRKLTEKKYDGIAESYETAARAYPTFCYLWYRAGIYRHEAKEMDRASTDFNNALICEPEAKNLHLLFADLIKETDCNLAIKHFSRSLEIDGETVLAFDGLSLCYEKLGDKDLSMEYYKKYKKLYFDKGGNPINFFFHEPLRHL
jgi:tetratricopeptide (TPR) repeat protein